MFSDLKYSAGAVSLQLGVVVLEMPHEVLDHTLRTYR